MLYYISVVPALDVDVFLRGFPVDSNFFTGLELNLTCIIHISPIGLDISTSFAVSAEWSKSGTSLTTNSRVTLDEGAVEVGPLQYQTSLLFKSLDKTRDEGTYTCSVHVIHSLEGFLDAVTDTAASRSILMHSKSDLNNIIDTYIINCKWVQGPYFMSVGAIIFSILLPYYWYHILRSDV